MQSREELHSQEPAKSEKKIALNGGRQLYY